MTKRDDKARERRLDAMAKSEANIHERLISMRSELDVIARLIDRATLARPPRLLAWPANVCTVLGASSAANSRNSIEGSQPSKVGSLFSFDIPLASVS